ncbi:cytochrome c oxidase subunit 2A [Cohnella lubricantis]|uniref:cytochrome c oxidase subunit 2A n=1 Tax=Cohnella lubricantis TaxID=2163172 RepID=UPI001FD99522|nr:cytochrome c oxidase subunit 2A [Cohnella lubricantis]MBP2117750.1 hypothetical protein [Cohnella lubricantis]
MAQSVKNILQGEDRKEKPGAVPASEQPSSGEPQLKGTFASVMLLGAFLLAAWVAVFILYLYRK